ncbi:MAG: acyl-CoA carboxylase subunit beta [Zoogloea sp.]|nr:acyl-CoA carboxylase subunit beta [Zoogloea sp.]
MQDLIDDLRRRQEEAFLGGGAARQDKQREAGKLTARERVAALVDEGSFEEIGLFATHRSTLFGMEGKQLPADGVVTGAGSIGGRLVHLASQDFTVAGGSAGEVHSIKVAEIMHQSLKTGSPFVFINDSGGARVQEGVDSLSGYGKVFNANVLLSGAVPQISLICGPCAGGAAYSPALTDFIIQTRQAQLFITGPQVIKQVTGESVTAEQLGGPDAHMIHSGVIHFIAEDDRHAILLCQKLLSFLPANNLEDPPQVEGDCTVDPNPLLETLVPVDTKQAYDVIKVITAVVDFGDFLEVQAGHARNIVVGFGRIGGNSVGIVANQPSVQAGVLDIDASNKASRFIRFCNAFNIPILTFVDVKITVILRKSYGGAYLAMCGKDLGADRVFAWPTAEVAVMGAEGAAEIVFRKEIEEADKPEEKRQELIAQYREAFSNPYVAAEHRLVDAVIEPALTRRHVAQALEYLRIKRQPRPHKKHGLMPL